MQEEDTLGQGWRPDPRSVVAAVALVTMYLVSLRLNDLSGSVRILLESGTTGQFHPPAVLQRLEVVGLVVGAADLAAAVAATWFAVAPRRWTRRALQASLAMGTAANVAAIGIGASSNPSHPTTAYLLAALLRFALAALITFAAPGAEIDADMSHPAGRGAINSLGHAEG